MKPDILTPFLDDADVILYAGDCVEVMKRMPGSSVDAIVTDPPYGLEFMGKAWDGFGAPLGFQTWTEAWALEAFRVLKPGGHLLAFAGTRTYHRMASGVEDAGFEIRDCIAWMYGSGFPKSLDVSKAIDKANGKHDRDLVPFGDYVRNSRIGKGWSLRQLDEAMGTNTAASWWEGRKSGIQPPGTKVYKRLKVVLDLDDRFDELIEWIEAEREIVGRAKGGIVPDLSLGERHTVGGHTKEFDLTAPATPEATKRNGWGTALKPAFEPIVVARRPLIGTVAQNVLEHGTGALNIDATRIGTDLISANGGGRNTDGRKYGNARGIPSIERGSNPHVGRWPANVALDATAANMLDEQSGTTTSGAAGRKGSSGFADGYDGEQYVPYGDTGGASRFFYTAKASRQDRNVGGLADNTHPTVKPTDLMRWLIRLVTPPGGIILDPFGGSGSTGLAARAENVRCILIEREPEYLQIIRDRLAQQNLFATDTTTDAT